MMTKKTDPHPWWHHAAVYQVYPRSFRDGNGDGLGDLRGVINGLNYLRDLGVQALWLSPFYPSPLRDSGYDVADPRAVDPMYGTLADFDELVRKAHARDLKVIVDIVPNHLSADHPWFQAALAAPPGSPERARFHFRDGVGDQPPNNWASLFGGSAWTRITESDGEPGQWYLHLFDSSQPDVNWTNQDVIEDWDRTLRFWLDRGVDGFRVDVALGLAKDMTYPNIDDPVGLTEALRFDLADGSPEERARRSRVANSAIFDRDEVQDIYARWRHIMNSYDGDRMAVLEAWVPPERAARYVAPTSLHQIFGFDFLVAPWDASAMRRIIAEVMEAVTVVGAPPTWALSNHDSPRVVSRLGGGTQGEARARALALVVQALPGSVYVFQGEELGLPDAPLEPADRQDPVFHRTNGAQLGRDACRVPLPWSGTQVPYGFTSAAHTTWLPQPGDWTRFTVQAEAADPTSTWHVYRRALHERMRWVDEPFAFIDSPANVLAFRRGDLVCAMNCGDTEVELAISGDLVVSSRDPQASGPSTGVLGPDETVWINAPS